MKAIRVILGVLGLVGLAYASTWQLLAQEWMPTSAPTNYWIGVACSADARTLVAAASNSTTVYVSTNAGATWFSNSTPGGPLNAVASSGDGSKLVAVGNEYPAWRSSICLSTNYGGTWTLVTNVPPVVWNYVASSADGSILIASGAGYRAIGGIFFSTNSGISWTDAGFGLGFSVAATSDGTKMLAVGSYTLLGTPRVFSSTNFGLTWATINDPASDSTCCRMVACSGDGERILITKGYVGEVHISPDFGVTWTSGSLSNHYRSSPVCSANGRTLLAGAGSWVVDISVDSGTTWVPVSAPGETDGQPLPVACSADGGKLVAAVPGGGIWIYQFPVTPVLTIKQSGNDLQVSWIVPSTEFVLQENSDLTTGNWTDVSTPPTLSYSNLQHQVSVPATAQSRFFRLKAR